jgi:hypothetical protein
MAGVIAEGRRMEEPRKPWYSRPLPLPRWLPEWSIICLAVGGALAFVAAFITRDHAYVPLTAAAGFGVGFLFGVWVASYTAWRNPDSGWKPPPFWLAFPVHVAALAGCGALAVANPVIYGPHGGTLLEGPAAVAAGILLILAGLSLSVWALASGPRRPGRVVGGVAGLLLSLAASALTVVTIWRRTG